MGGEVMDRVMGKIGEDIMGSHSRMIKNFFLVAPLLSENFFFFFFRAIPHKSSLSSTPPILNYSFVPAALTHSL